jgi:hypothetical protein
MLENGVRMGFSNDNEETYWLKALSRGPLVRRFAASARREYVDSLDRLLKSGGLG